MMMEFLSQPWPWYVAGPIIALTFFLLNWYGKSFGVSSNLRTMCTIGGGDKCSTFFKINASKETWNLIFLLGSIIGGYLAASLFMDPEYRVDIAQDTVRSLEGLGIDDPGAGFLPESIFSWSALSNWKGWAFMLLGGFLVGFGARYAGGCTSGHAISGLSTFQLPSLIAVVGFFIGGLLMTYFLLPYLLAS